MRDDLIFTLLRASALGLAIGGLAACASPSAKISAELMRYGLDQRQAACVGDRLESRLSIGQLQQLAGAARAYSRDDADPGRLTLGDLARASSQIDDPRVPIEVAGAATGCGVVANLLSNL